MKISCYPRKNGQVQTSLRYPRRKNKLERETLYFKETVILLFNSSDLTCRLFIFPKSSIRIRGNGESSWKLIAFKIKSNLLVYWLWFCLKYILIIFIFSIIWSVSVFLRECGPRNPKEFDTTLYNERIFFTSAVFRLEFQERRSAAFDMFYSFSNN